jgi:hypothetical protein
MKKELVAPIKLVRVQAVFGLTPKKMRDTTKYKTVEFTGFTIDDITWFEGTAELEITTESNPPSVTVTAEITIDEAYDARTDMILEPTDAMYYDIKEHFENDFNTSDL